MLAMLRQLSGYDTTPARIARIARLNDALRARPYSTPNSRVLFSAGVMEMADVSKDHDEISSAAILQTKLLMLVRGALTDNVFSPSDKRRQGNVNYRSAVCCFRIDYCGQDLYSRARDPASASTTPRIPSVKLATEDC